MRKALSLLLLFSCIFLFSCESISAQKLDSPKLILFENRVEWEMVDNATEYEIVTTQKTIKTQNTVFYFADYCGEIKIRCLGDNKTYSHSDYAIVEVVGKENN